MRKKHAYNLSHLHSLTCDMGYLVPCCLFDVLPNDTISMSTKAFIRVQPMLAPIMHEISVITQTWYVPYRLLWRENDDNNWETFITGGDTGSEDLNLTFPTIKAPSNGGFAIGSLADYFGYPVNQPDIEVSALPHRAYAMIYNERYRDEDLVDEVPLSLDSGLDSVTSLDLLRPAWKRDFATTARPWTQRGTEVSVPINTASLGTELTLVSCSANFSWSHYAYFSVETTDKLSNVRSSRIGVTIKNFIISSDTISKVALQGHFLDLSFTIPSRAFSASDSRSFTYTDSKKGISCSVVISGSSDVSFTLPSFGVDLSVEVTSVVAAGDGAAIKDISFSTSDSSRGVVTLSDVIFQTNQSSQATVNIRDLRNAAAIQRYEENSAKWGNRYEEYVQRSFGISPRDARVQRPEFVGSSKGSLTFSEVLQTAEGDQTQVGSMYGHGVGGISQKKCVLKVPEHGLVMTLLSIRPKSVYSQGIMRAWLKRTKFEFFTPELAHIGMQEVYQQELFANKDNKGVVFGYQDRNYEYKSILPKVCGEFRGNLDFWNMARKFEQPPVLNSDFITMNPTKRIFGVTDQSAHSLLCMVRNDITARRVVPKSTESKLM